MRRGYFYYSILLVICNINRLVTYSPLLNRTSMKTIVFIICIILLGAGIAFSQSFSVDTINHIKKSTVYIQVKHLFPITDDEISSSGTGFFINRHGHIVTNYHVIQPLISIYNSPFPAPVSGIKIIRSSGTEDHKIFDATIIAVDKDNDLAILAINDTADTPFLNIGHSGSLVESMPIFVFGYPLGEEFAVIQRGPEITVSKGFISALRHDDRSNLTQIQVDAVVQPGNSGGPVINEKCVVIGVINRAYGETRMNFAVPVYYLHELVKDIPAENLFGEDAVLEASSNPAGASVFIDWEPFGNTPNNIGISQGWHTLCMMKPGYETWIKERSVFGVQNESIDLIPVKPLVIPPCNRNMQDISPEIKDLWENITGNLYNNAGILLNEKFNDKERFNKWEQNTGGNETRTWYLQNGILHQHENNELLHAISLGETTWDDYLMKARVKISDEKGDGRAGLIFRETDKGFYLFRIHKETDKAQLAYHSKYPFGWFVLKQKDLNLDITDKYYSMAVYATGNTLSCFLDSICIFTTNAEYSGNGKIGFYSVDCKASFDSLTIYDVPKQKSTETPQEQPEIHSFWFSDYFNQESVWWYQYEDSYNNPSPWHFSDAGCIQMSDDNRARYCEFTKYRFSDFSMLLVVTLSEGNDSSSFDIFFRKEQNSYLTLSFSKKDNKINLISIEDDNEKILKKSNLPATFFNNYLVLSLDVNGDDIICKSSNNIIFRYKMKDSVDRPGVFGFSTYGTRAVLHQLSITSAIEQKRTSGKKKK